MKNLMPLALPVMMTLALVNGGLAQASADSRRLAGDGAPITLTIGDKVIPAILYDTLPARDLMAKLPVTVSLNRGPIDYCGGIDPIDYGKEDVQAGYRNGDLAYWVPGQDFVIFTAKEETSSGVSDLVIIGRVRCDIEEIQGLDSTIEVTIALDR